MPDTAVGALAALGAVVLLAGMMFGTGKHRVGAVKAVPTNSASKSVANKAGSTKAGSTGPTTAPAVSAPATPIKPAPAKPGEPVAVADPAPPKAPSSRCGLVDVSTDAGGASWLPDMTVGFSPDANVDEIYKAVTTAPWASGYLVESGFETYSGTASVTVKVPPSFSKVDFAVAEKWFAALPGFKRFARSPKPSTAAIGCLIDVADTQRVEQVLTDLVLAGKIDGFSLLSSGVGAELQLTRGTSDRDWKALEATFSSFGTVTSWTVFDAWPSV
jgi:hypothetical protein